MTGNVEMCASDEHPTCYDLTPVQDTPRTASITEYEQAALSGIDVVERVVDPINRFTLARCGVRIVAYVARILRDKRP